MRDERYFPPGKLLMVRDLAEKLNVLETTIYNWIAIGYIPAKKFGPGKRKTVRIYSDDVNDWIDREFFKQTKAYPKESETSRKNGGQKISKKHFELFLKDFKQKEEN